MRSRIQEIYQQKPLATILCLGLIVRLVAAIFSKGYGMHDDHFLVIEAGQSIAAGHDYNNWLPWNSGGVPSGHSWFYVGIHVLIFRMMDFIGIMDPQVKMLFIRVLHAVYSLLVVSLSFQIVRRVSTEENARLAALLLALIWFIPAMSVRNLVEWVCVPPLLAASLALLKHEKEGGSRYILLTGFWLGIAMGIRYQTMFFLGGVGLYLLFSRQWRAGILCLLAWFGGFFLTQSPDLFLYHRPFVELEEYIRYNFVNSTSYFDRPWYMYFLTLGGMIIPPISIFLFTGFVRSFRQLLVLSLPALCFFVFHSYFPNKQERFILPFVPYLVMCGVIGWNSLQASWKSGAFVRGSWKFFWTLNTFALLVFCTMYSKRSRVEAMYYLYKQADYNNFLVEASHLDSDPIMPQYYSGKWQKSYGVSKSFPLEQFRDSISRLPKADFPNYILFFEEDSLAQRTARFENGLGVKLHPVFEAEPSYMDDVLHRLNKHNRNQPVYVYRVEK